MIILMLFKIKQIISYFHNTSFGTLVIRYELCLFGNQNVFIPPYKLLILFFFF